MSAITPAGVGAVLLAFDSKYTRFSSCAPLPARTVAGLAAGDAASLNKAELLVPSVMAPKLMDMAVPVNVLNGAAKSPGALVGIMVPEYPPSWNGPPKLPT